MSMLKAENITKRYLTKPVLNGLDITLEEGKIYGLLGPNASGKTTFMKIIAGLVEPSSGSVSVMNYRIGRETKNVVSFMPTINHLPKWMKVKQCIELFHDSFPDFDREKAGETLEFMGIKDEQKVRELSTGMLGRLKLTLAVCRKAKLFVLDEPLNGLDPVSREKVIEVILAAAEKDNTFLISSHLINELENILDEVIFLDQGKVILSGNTEELRQAKSMSVDKLYREVYKNV